MRFSAISRKNNFNLLAIAIVVTVIIGSCTNNLQTINAATVPAIDICTATNAINSLINNAVFTSLQQNICKSPSSSQSQPCGNANNQLANLVMCSMGAKSCGFEQQYQSSNLMGYFAQIMPTVFSKVPDISQFFTNPIVCAVVQQSCCLSAGQSNIDMANLIYSAVTGKPSQLISATSINTSVNNLFHNVVSSITGGK